MSFEAKVRAGATEWTASPTQSGQRTGLPEQPTRRQFPLELCRGQIDVDQFIGSEGFNFLAESFADGEFVSFSGALKAGEFFAVEDVTTALRNESVRAAMAQEVSRRSGGKTSFGAATKAEIDLEPLKAPVHLAIERDGERRLFGVHETGLEPHTTKIKG